MLPEVSQGLPVRPSAARQLELGRWIVTEERAREYLRAVGDSSPIYLESRLCPPLALAAHALGALLEELTLPAGAVHATQEMEVRRAVQLGEEVSAVAQLPRPRRWGSGELIAANYAVLDGAGGQVLTGRSTVLMMTGEPQRDRGNPTALRMGEAGRLPAVAKTITRGQLEDYARASGDHNPLHLDPEFAATTQFGGVIAHGMLTLAFVAEMLVAAFGQAWLQTGALKVKFTGPARLGAQLETWGCVAREEPQAQHRLVVCSVGLRERGSGQELISGTASVKR